jgi:hypothetical protein
MLKALLVVVPMFMTASAAWATWITGETYANRSFREAGNRFTATNGEELRNEVHDLVSKATKAVYDAHLADLRSVEQKISDLPPRDWRDKINAIEARQFEILRSVTELNTLVRQHMDIKRGNQ